MSQRHSRGRPGFWRERGRQNSLGTHSSRRHHGGARVHVNYGVLAVVLIVGFFSIASASAWASKSTSSQFASPTKVKGPNASNHSTVTEVPADPDLANAIVPDSDITGFTPNEFAGNDDGSWPCGPDGVSAPAACSGSETGPEIADFGFNVNFFGTEYSGAYINNNGNITFGQTLGTYTPFGLESTDTVIIAPFFADVDTRVGNTVNLGDGNP